MKIRAYSVYDVKLEAFASPFFARTDGEAIRMFETTAKDPTTQINQYPEDYTLWFVGEFDSENGLMHPHTVIQLCAAWQAARDWDEKPEGLSAVENSNNDMETLPSA